MSCICVIFFQKSSLLLLYSLCKFIFKCFCMSSCSKLPSWARAVVPKIFYVTEKAWNYYPYTVTGEYWDRDPNCDCAAAAWSSGWFSWAFKGCAARTDFTGHRVVVTNTLLDICSTVTLCEKTSSVPRLLISSADF